jgi:short-subunit dehydrogenase
MGAAIITGASSGMGLHYANQLAEYGYDTILVSNQKEQVEQASKDIAQKLNYSYIELGSNRNCGTPFWTTGVYMDLSAPESAKTLFDLCESNNIEVEVLVNNAGIFFFNDIADCSLERVSTIVNLHVYTVTMLCRLFGEKMRERKKGYIINMSSISAHTPFCGISLYTATKSYLRTMSKAFRLEMKEFGVRVMVVCPGAVATDLYRLPKNLQQLGVNLGVIYRPEKLVRKALYKLFYTNTKEFIPGIINRLFKPIYAILPEWFKMWARKKTASLKK